MKLEVSDGLRKIVS